MPYRERPAKLEPGEIEECPGCHTTVMVRHDLTCPACQCDMLSVRDDGMRRLQAFDHQVLPPICAGCGATTDHFQRLHAAHAGQPEMGPMQRLWLSLLSPLLGLLVPRGGVTIEVSVPCCRRCASAGPLQPEHVNFERGCVTLLVHHRLRDAVDAALRDDE